MSNLFSNPEFQVLDSKVSRLSYQLKLISEWLVQEFGNKSGFASDLKDLISLNTETDQEHNNEPIENYTNNLTYVNVGELYQHSTVPTVIIKPDPDGDDGADNYNHNFQELEEQEVQFSVKIEQPEETFSRDPLDSSDSETETDSDSDYCPPKMRKLDKSCRTSQNTPPGSSCSTTDESNNTENFQCNICNAVFAQASSLAIHQTRLHSEQVTYKCPNCPETFNTQFQLNDHTSTEHSKPVEYKCTLCGPSSSKNMETFSSVNKLLHHRAESHNLGHEKQLYICEYCFRTFKRKETLKGHQYGHANLKTVNCKGAFAYGDFKCNICDAKFGTETSLNTHKTRLHPGQMPYYCNLCVGKKKLKFGTIDELTHHTVTTHPQYHNNYICPYCNLQFVTNKSRETHIKKTHVFL